MSTPKRGRLKLAEDISFEPWWWQARNRAALPEPDLPGRIEFAIIGGGYTGLSAALTLAQAGAKVAVFDSADPGDGASSRNGGMVGNRIKPAFSSLVRMFDEKRAVRLMDEGEKAVDYVDSLITDLGIDCDFSRMGRFSPAVNKAHWKAMQAEMEAEKTHRDPKMEMVAPEEQSQFLGSSGYHGGRLQHGTGGLHPARYHDGLLAAVRDAGVTVAARTEILSMEETDTGMALETGLGFIEADKVLICTNGYTGPQLKEMHERVIPVRSAIIATEELDPDLVGRLIPGGRMIVDSYNLLNYFRPSPDGKRILWGTRPGLGGGTRHKLAETIGKRLGRVFPELDGTAISHCWWGNVAFSFDTFPKIGMDERVGYAMAYAGSGVAMSTWLGHKLGQKAMEDLSGRTAFDDMAFDKPFYYSGWPWFLKPLSAWYSINDWIAGGPLR